MGRIGFQELLVILVLALLIFGPSKLPEIGRSLGKGIGEFRQASRNFKDGISLEDEDRTDKS